MPDTPPHTGHDAPAEDHEAVGGGKGPAAPSAEPEQDYPPIADYGLIGDTHSCALVSRAGSIDWLCFPRFDSASVFGRIIDWGRGGHFAITPVGIRNVTRRYLPRTNVLETTFETNSGVARLTDFMAIEPESDPAQPKSVQTSHLVARILECVEGSVDVRLDCQPRFDYGSIRPHVALVDEHNGFAHGGADAIALYCSAPLRIEGDGYVGEARLAEGKWMTAAVSYESRFGHRAEDVTEHAFDRLLADTTDFWEKWASTFDYEGEFADQVLRLALTLKALSHAPTGALVAAPTTSLPEHIGGPRNWDYRFTWIRDAAFAVYALSIVGLHREAATFKEWLEWSTAGHPAELRVMYGLGGEHRLTEQELPLRGYRDSRPVRIGNGAQGQFQLDIYGELMDSAHLYRRLGNEVDPEYWEFLRGVVDFVIDHWREPDDGVWESRGDRQHFVFSKAMCWVALDRAVSAVEETGLPGDVERWRRVRDEIRVDVLAQGFNERIGAFTQAYGSDALDASVLMLPLFRFIDANDPKMRSTIEVIKRDLTNDQGFVYRYRNLDDGVGGDEGTFTICTFWLCDNLVELGEIDEARDLFCRAMAVANDLGLYSEETDVDDGMLGNFPQAFSHLSMINAAVHLSRAAHEQD